MEVVDNIINQEGYNKDVDCPPIDINNVSVIFMAVKVGGIPKAVLRVYKVGKINMN
jgi:hypothetical protein